MRRMRVACCGRRWFSLFMQIFVAGCPKRKVRTTSAFFWVKLFFQIFFSNSFFSPHVYQKGCLVSVAT